MALHVVVLRAAILPAKVMQRIPLCSLFTGAMGGQDFEIMLAHYYVFLSTVLYSTFFCIASIFARWTERNCSGNHSRKANFRLLLTSYLNLQHPVIAWALVKYQFHIPINYLFIKVSESSTQILYRLMRPGTPMIPRK